MTWRIEHGDCVEVMRAMDAGSVDAIVTAGKLTIGLLEDGEPDLMWKMLDGLAMDIAEVAEMLLEVAQA